jgi:hypothetical protein
MFIAEPPEFGTNAAEGVNEANEKLTPSTHALALTNVNAGIVILGKKLFCSATAPILKLEPLTINAALFADVPAKLRVNASPVELTRLINR